MNLTVQPLEQSDIELIIEENSSYKKTEKSSVKSMQRTEDWHEERRGNWTASQFKKLMTCSSAGGKLDWLHQEKVFRFSDGAVKYIYANAMERKTGRYLVTDSTKEMKYGTKIEPLIFKRASAELKKLGLTLQEVGFKTFPNIPTAGVSSDSIVLNEAGEIVASFESKACSSWVTLYDRTYEQTDESSGDFWQTQGQMLAWEVEENYYCVISPPKDINVYLYAENVMDLYDEWCNETEMHLEIIKKSPIHLNCLLQRIQIAESTVERFLEQDTDETLKEILYEEIDSFRDNLLGSKIETKQVEETLAMLEETPKPLEVINSTEPEIIVEPTAVEISPEIEPDMNDLPF